MNARNPPLEAELDAALDWWRLAGVTHDFSEDATDWLNATGSLPPMVRGAESAKAAIEPAQDPEPAQVDLFGGSPPGDLADFHRFWIEAPGLDAVGPRGRVLPRGASNAELMVLVIDPEECDSERLLSGPQGRLLDQMLPAMNLKRDQVYIASALPRHTPMPDTATLAVSGMEAVTLHHIALAAPKRVIAFGASVLPLLGHELTKELSDLREINQTARCTPLLVSEGLDSMIGMPRLKARFWRRWIEWSAN